MPPDPAQPTPTLTIHPGIAPNPTARRQPQPAALGERLIAALFAAGFLGILVLSAWLKPDPSGHGTHVQLGLPPCAMLQTTGYPCPSCGMTTAFAHAARGDLLNAARAQPMGALLALGCSIGFWIALYGAVLGVRLGPVAQRLFAPRMIILLAATWAASWAYTIATWR